MGDRLGSPNSPSEWTCGPHRLDVEQSPMHRFLPQLEWRRDVRPMAPAISCVDAQQAPCSRVDCSGDVKRNLRRCLVLVIAAMLSGCASTVTTPTPSLDAVVYVIGRDWHTDIGLPVGEISGAMTSLKRDFPGVKYLTFGFGERQFLLRRDRTFGAMLSALLPSRSAVLMTALSATPEAAFGARHVVVLHVSMDGSHRIADSIWQELDKPPDGVPMPLADGPYPGSVFYPSRDTYDGLFTCNSWTVATLRTGGLAVPTVGVLFASQVMRSARDIAAKQQSMGHN
jgi:Protein of unknown function (DUF2459)